MNDCDHTVSRISVYTDGSCHSATGIGGWAAILLLPGEEVMLSGKENDTTHQRMELTAAVEAISHLKRVVPSSKKIVVYTDSQYLADLPRRQSDLVLSNFRTRKKQMVPNVDLLLQLFGFLDTLVLAFVKVRSHEKVAGWVNYNRQVDKHARKIVRDSVRNLSF